MGSSYLQQPSSTVRPWRPYPYACGHGIVAARDVKPAAAVADPRDLDGKFTISDFHKMANIGSPERTKLVALVERYSLRDHSHDNMENSKGGLFTVDELHNNFQAGKMLPIFFPNKDPATSPFLPKKVADSIPFSSAKLPEILRLFSIARGSPLAKSMEDTLSKCEYAPVKGETKTCATSLESMVDFLSGAFKVTPQDTKFITTTHPTMSTSSLQNYRVLGAPKEIKSSRKVACHPMPYPYAVFFCHYDQDSSETRVFKVSMVGENTKDRVDAAAVCHMDSASAALLNLTDKQGKSPMCHFFSAGDLIWGPLGLVKPFTWLVLGPAFQSVFVFFKHGPGHGGYLYLWL
ncbi:hypothetical protein V6N12_060828 [Hibiscus sabdariffa]|uniref:BURP domain-containing protein n=1 Tax=Hibiscus sabdariffa TaxID=183260 RepID=A0ABR2D5L6_9ROSI